MKIALAGIGRIEIDENADLGPEVAIWQTKINLEKLGADVQIINTKDPAEFQKEVHRIKPDILHVHHFDLFKMMLDTDVPIKIATTQNPFMDQLKGHMDLVKGFQKKMFRNSIFDKLNPFKTDLDKSISDSNVLYPQKLKPSAKALAMLSQNKNRLYVFCMSERMKKLFGMMNIPEDRMFVTPNGANSKLFRFEKEVKFPNKSIYVANIVKRKRQYLYQSIESIDFVGPVWHNRKKEFDTTIPNYKGGWTRDEIHHNLTDYANLVLLSSGEAHPLTGCEGMMAGLGLVVSEVASGNLDRSKPFIDVIPEEKIHDIPYVTSVIEKNRATSITMREEIRKYAEENFQWEGNAKKYYAIAEKLMKKHQLV